MHFLHYEYKDHRYNTSLDTMLNLTSAMCTKQPWRAWLTGMCEKGNARWRDEKRRHLLISLNYCFLDSSEQLFLSFCFVRRQKETTRTRHLKCQGLICVPCSLFSRRFVTMLFYLHNLSFGVTYNQKLHADPRMQKFFVPTDPWRLRTMNVWTDLTSFFACFLF